MRGDLNKGTYLDPDLGRQRWVDFADEWAESRDWTGTTRDTFLAACRARLVPHIANMPLAAFELLDLQRLQTKLKNHPYAPKTVELTMT